MSRVSTLGLTLALALAVAIAAGLSGNPYHDRLMFMVTVYYLCGLGMNVLVGYTGQKSLGQAGLFAAGAYTVAVLTSRFDWNPWAAFVAAGLMSALFGILVAMPALRAKGPYLAMVTLAFGVVVERTVTEWTDVFGGPSGLYGIKPLTWAGQAFNDKQWIWFGIALCTITHLLLQNLLVGRHGRALRSLQIDELASASVGVRVYRYKVLAFVIAAITCGLGGAMVAQQVQYINSDYVVFHLSIFILLIVLLGGAGSQWGPLLGAVVLVGVDALLAKWPAVQHLSYGALLLFALYLMPNGIAGALAWAFKHVRRAPGAEAPSVARRDEAPTPRAVGGPLLDVQRISKSYGGVKPAQAVSLLVREHQIHALIGPNGAGKSTMVNILTGVVKADEGQIHFQAQAIAGRAPADLCVAGIARTFQNLRLFGEMSVLENVLLGQHARMRNGLISALAALPFSGRQEAAARAEAIRLLDTLGLLPFAAKPAGSLPYGLQRRVELARALATQPKLLLLDEPAAGLNPQETQALGGVLQRIRDSGVTILMVEHHMELVMAISDHVTVLDHGVCIASGTPAQVRADPLVIQAYLGTDADDDAQELAHAPA